MKKIMMFALLLIVLCAVSSSCVTSKPYAVRQPSWQPMGGCLTPEANYYRVPHY